LTHNELEQTVLKSFSGDVAWPLVELFSTLIRTSGTGPEREAARAIMMVLDRHGVTYRLHEPELFLSTPQSAHVIVRGSTYNAKPPAFSVSTPEEGVAGKLLYMKSGAATGTTDLFESDLEALPDLSGYIVMVDGLPMPKKVSQIEASGAVAGIFINPGERIHEGICTQIWGTPGLSDLSRKPRIPVVGVNNRDGQALISLAMAGETAVVHSRLEEAWKTCPLVIAEVKGAVVPEQYVLLHGHLDSWHYGIGDNATGNAAMLELAVRLHEVRHELKRSVRIAWWPGHSTGRYAGSTWYADHFALDLVDNCIAQLNCDSPGCRDATEFTELSAMSEAVDFVRKCIEDVTGLSGAQVETERPPRAGDYSFNNLGLTGFMMLSSIISRAGRKSMGLYTVGGCGGNNEWHTEADLMPVADRPNLVRDMRVYAAMVLRCLNAVVFPFDFIATAGEFKSTLLGYQASCGDLFDYAPAIAETERFIAAMRNFHLRCLSASGLSSSDPEVEKVNNAILQIARIIVPLNYTKVGRFYHDSAVNAPALPLLAPEAVEPSRAKFLSAELRRGSNDYIYALRRAIAESIK
jgi:N-acetylated-alpha-linked acidic dipeptidase